MNDLKKNENELRLVEIKQCERRQRKMIYVCVLVEVFLFVVLVIVNGNTSVLTWAEFAAVVAAIAATSAFVVVFTSIIASEVDITLTLIIVAAVLITVTVSVYGSSRAMFVVTGALSLPVVMVTTLFYENHRQTIARNQGLLDEHQDGLPN